MSQGAAANRERSGFLFHLPIVARLPSPSVVFAVLVPWLRASIDASRHFAPSRTWCLSTDVSGLTPPRTPLMFGSCRDVRRSRCVSLVSPSKGSRLVADAWVRIRSFALAHTRACKKPPNGIVSLINPEGQTFHGDCPRGREFVCASMRIPGLFRLTFVKCIGLSKILHMDL